MATLYLALPESHRISWGGLPIILNTVSSVSPQVLRTKVQIKYGVEYIIRNPFEPFKKLIAYLF